MLHNQEKKELHSAQHRPRKLLALSEWKQQVKPPLSPRIVKAQSWQGFSILKCRRLLRPEISPFQSLTISDMLRRFAKLRARRSLKR